MTYTASICPVINVGWIVRCYLDDECKKSIPAHDIDTAIEIKENWLKFNHVKDVA